MVEQIGKKIRLYGNVCKQQTLKNIHSIKTFCGTQYGEANDDEKMHRHLNHTKYLGMYNRLSEEKQKNIFLKAEPLSSIYDKMVVVEKDDDDAGQKLIEEVKQHREEVTET